MSQRVASSLRRSQRSAVAAVAAVPATTATPTPTPAAAPKSTLDEPIFFASASAFDDWLAAHHATESEVFVGYYKKASGRQTVTWSETVDVALCWGWIDGHGRGGLADGAAFAKRFTPRRNGGGAGGARSHWSRVNVAKATALAAAGRLRAPGRAAWALRTPGATAQQAFERGAAAARPLSAAFAARLAADAAAAAFWAGPRATAAYRRDAADWVMAAKRPETRERRLAQLVEASAQGARVKHLAR